MRQKYVLIYACIPDLCIPEGGPGCPMARSWDWYGDFVIVRKDRPDWQKGKLNLIGGHIEDGESWKEAAVRELEEETGMEPFSLYQPQLLGMISGKWGEVYCVKIYVGKEKIKPRMGETERPEWTTYSAVKEDEMLMPNLRVIIPLMEKGLSGWVVTDEGPTWLDDRHTFTITVDSYSKEREI